MRSLVSTAVLAGVALSLVGCGSARKPQLIILPSYSYVQTDLAMGVESDVITGSARAQSSVAKLPPMPAAPGFESLVLNVAAVQID